MISLLERWDELGAALAAIRPNEIRRAIAIAQAVEEVMPRDWYGGTRRALDVRADELLEGR